MDFKIIAVTPLERCNKKYRRVLTPGQDYYIYNEYEISNDKIRQKTNNVPALYLVNKTQVVNISAIVGKNGSGKSTVMELVYALIYNVSYLGGILPEIDDEGNRITLLKGLRARICYQIDNKFYQIWFDGRTAFYRVQYDLTGTFSEAVVITKNNIFKLEHLFYSIVTNYSHHSLNSRHQGWLRYVFHKNDGYQTPIVINPFRDEGKIDMDREEELTTARIVASLLTLRSGGMPATNELAPDKYATHVKFTLNREKVRFHKRDQDMRRVLQKNRDFILELTFAAFGITNPPKILSTKDPSLKVAYAYIAKKLYSITQRYKPYQGQEYEFVRRVPKTEVTLTKGQGLGLDSEKLLNLLRKIIDNPSHITFKLRQAVNYVNNYTFYNNYLGKFVELKVFADEVDRFRNETSDNKQELMAVIPPSFFAIDIQFKDKGTLKSLSSGEKQQIFASASWMYHIINLASVREEEEVGYRQYKCINLVFDEIELYYHPEMQREFLQKFLYSLCRLNLGPAWGINCIFITHSPFILSDIPHQNILFLNEDGTPFTDPSNKLTFGANIHELLKHHFFLKNGTIGAFASRRIESLIAYLSRHDEDEENLVEKQDGLTFKWTNEVADQFINVIAEPLIKQSLRTLFFQKINSKTKRSILQEIELLTKELENFS